MRCMECGRGKLLEWVREPRGWRVQEWDKERVTEGDAEAGASAIAAESRA